MIKIVVDSTAYLTKEYCTKHDIAMVPQNTYLDGEHEVEGFPGEFDAFFEKVKNTSSFPKTSQPTPEKFLLAFEHIVNNSEEDEIICITSSTGISGTYNSACVARDTFAEDVRKRISIIDALCAVQLIWTLVEHMVRLIEKGESREHIVQFVEQEKLLGRAYLTAYNLEYLRKGGRCSGVSAFIGTILNIKPVISLNDGRLSPFTKCIGHKKAVQMMVDSIPENAYNVGTAYVYRVDENLNYLNELLQKRFGDRFVNKNLEIGSVIGSHLGPYSFGVMFFDPNKKK